MGKGPWSLIGWTWSWRSSLPSLASVALVEASPLSAKQPLVGFCLHRPTPAFLDGITSRLLAQPALWAEPVFLPLSLLTTIFGLQRRYFKMASNEKIIVEKLVRLVETSNFGFWIISIRGHMQFLGSNQKSWNRG
jgi:hypothetical protein